MMYLQLIAERAEEAKKKAAEKETETNKQQSQGRNKQRKVFGFGVAKYINMKASGQ
jgi:hypothetical protein